MIATRSWNIIGQEIDLEGKPKFGIKSDERNKLTKCNRARANVDLPKCTTYFEMMPVII